MGFTSSLSEPRTKAYTERILSVEGKVFSSILLSENLILMVVWDPESAFGPTAREERGSRDEILWDGERTWGQRACRFLLSASRMAAVRRGAFWSASRRAVSMACWARTSAAVASK